MVKVKICGITRSDDAIFACDYGADALGFVFYNKSPMYITPERAGSIIKKLPPSIEKVGVFVNESPDRINNIIENTGLTTVQLHGEELPEFMKAIKAPVIRAVRIRDKDDIKIMVQYSVTAFLLDSFTQNYGGSGRRFDWDIAIEAKKFGRIILSGGLTPENVAEAIRIVQPWGVDVSSGVELKPGVKDREKVREFIKNAKLIN